VKLIVYIVYADYEWIVWIVLTIFYLSRKYLDFVLYYCYAHVSIFEWNLRTTNWIIIIIIISMVVINRQRENIGKINHINNYIN
jgi:hypothetical protein